MAQKITRAEMEAEQKFDYNDKRAELKTGQLVFCSGRYLFSGIIQRLTKSEWSHGAIIYKDEELQRVMVLEAEPYIGTRLIPMSKYIRDYKGTNKPYKGRLYIADFVEPFTPDQLRKAISFGLDELTRPYDNWEIFRIMLRILFKLGKREKNKNYICSELVRECFARTGYHFPLTNSYISPDGIWSNSKVKKLYRLL